MPELDADPGAARIPGTADPGLSALRTGHGWPTNVGSSDLIGDENPAAVPGDFTVQAGVVLTRVNGWLRATKTAAGAADTMYFTSGEIPVEPGETIEAQVQVGDISYPGEKRCGLLFYGPGGTPYIDSTEVVIADGELVRLQKVAPPASGAAYLEVWGVAAQPAIPAGGYIETRDWRAYSV